MQMLKISTHLLGSGHHLLDLNFGQTQHRLGAFGAKLGASQLFLDRFGDLPLSQERMCRLRL